MLENLMLKREHFPLELLDYSGKFFPNPTIIPPFHSYIINNGINLNLALSVLDEAVENTLLDLKDSSRNNHKLLFNQETSKVKHRILGKNQQRIYLPEFPLTGGLYIEPEKISPYGGDNYLMIDKNSLNASYWIPIENLFSSELMNEYNTHELSKPVNNGRYRITQCQKGWNSHNVGFRDVFYKNLVIALNNATVKEIHSK